MPFIEKYRPLPSENGQLEIEDDEQTAFINESLRSLRYGRETEFRRRWMFVCLALNIIFFSISSILFATWYFNTFMLLNSELRRVSTYTPLHDLVDLELGARMVEGTLYPPKGGNSIARQPPNEETDEIWEEYEITRFFPVTADQIRAMGKDPATAAKLEDEHFGLGDDAYAAFLDVFHHLHCLNSLRKFAYQEYYGPGPYREPGRNQPEEMHGIHVNHCVDILMQAIMCSGNVNLATMHWVAEHPYPFPDMSVNRQCINFDKLVDWRKENTIDMETYKKVMNKEERESSIDQLPAPDMFYKLYHPNWTNPNHLNGANPGQDFNL